MEMSHLPSYSLFYQGFHRKMLPPQYVWITPGWFDQEWWAQDYGNLSVHCSMKDMRRVLKGSLSVVPFGYFPSKSPSLSSFSDMVIVQLSWLHENCKYLVSQIHNYCTSIYFPLLPPSLPFLSSFPFLPLLLTVIQTPNSFMNALRMREPMYSNLTELNTVGVAYDAVWAMALGLHHAWEQISRNDSRGCGHLPGELVPLEEFDYQNEMMGCVLRNSFHQVNFTGITVSFSCI